MISEFENFLSNYYLISQIKFLIMKAFSLSFFSDELEKQYQENNMLSHILVFQRNLILYSIIAAIIAFYSYYDNKIVLGLMATAVVVQIPLLYFMALKGHGHFDYFCFAFQTSLNVCVPLAIILNQISGPIEGANCYLIGQAMTFVSQSQNMGSRFYLKVMTMIINIIILMYMQFGINRDTTTAMTLFWLGSNLMNFNYIYWQDRLKREAFLSKNNEKLWQTEIGTLAQVSVMTCSSENGKLSLDIDRCNKQMLAQFIITDSETYKEFLNSVKIVHKSKFQPRIFKEINGQRKSQSYLTLHTWIDKFSQLSQLGNMQFVGLHQTCLYDIRIFTTWNEQILNIHMLMTKSSEQAQDEECIMNQIERNMFTDLRQKFVFQLKTIFSQLQGNKNQSKSSRGQLMCVLYDAMRLNHNLQLYLNPQYKLHKSDFLLQPLMDRLILVIRDSMPQPYSLNINSCIQPELKLKSCYKTIFHVIYNLFTIIVEDAQQSGYIKVNVQQCDSQVGSFINFSIYTNIKTQEVLMLGQNLYRNVHKKDQEFVANQQHGLEILVSEFLIGKIGPNRRIKINSVELSRAQINFSIFKDIGVLD